MGIIHDNTPNQAGTLHAAARMAHRMRPADVPLAGAVLLGCRHEHFRLFQSLIKLEQLGCACPLTGPSTPAFMNHVAPGGKSSIWEPGVMLSVGLL